MPASYSKDLRERVIAAVAAGKSARAAAGQFSIGVSTAIRWVQRWRAEGHAEARAMGGDHRSRLREHRAFALELVARHPDLTLEEIRQALAGSGITAPCVFDGAINGARFRAYVEQLLAPTLRPGDIVILDNLNSHKVAGIHEAIEVRGAQVLYLPPYSPDLKFKSALRKAAERTVDSLWQTIGQTLDCFSPQQCRNFFKQAGYAI